MAIVKGNGTGNTLNGVAIENDFVYGLGGNDIMPNWEVAFGKAVQRPEAIARLV